MAMLVAGKSAPNQHDEEVMSLRSVRTLVSITLMATAIASAAWAQPAAIEGVWRSQDSEGFIDIAACAADPATLCGKLVWIKKPLGDDGKPQRDVKNPDAVLQKRPVCGIEIVSAMKPQADGSYAGGSLYDPEEGKTYQGTLRLENTQLVVTGFVEVPVLGKITDSEKWTRVIAQFERCK
jgi:uncharacterized protein (DUF2147 family)